MSGFSPVGALIANIPSFAVDVIGMYDQDFKQIFAKARPLKAIIKPDYTNMQEPLETGAKTTDHRIIQPISIELFLVLQGEDYPDTYKRIKQLAIDGTLFTVQTRVDVYKNQTIISRPHEESPAMMDTIALGLKLEEVTIVDTQITTVPRNPANRSTKDRGNLQPGPSVPKKSRSFGHEALF